MDALGVAIRFALYLDLMAAFGLAAFGVLSLRGSERGTALPLRPVMVDAGALGIVLSVLGLLVMAAAMAGVPLTAIDRGTVTMLVTETAAGAAWIVRMAALALVVLVPMMGWKRPGWALSVIALAGGVAIATLAWTGHGEMDDGAIGWLHLCADIAHLIAAGVWIGALLGLSMLVMRRASRIDASHLALSHRALEGFSITGTVMVVVIVVSGLINSWLLVGLAGMRVIGDSLYGQLLVAKVMVFVAMIGLASVNRYLLTPALEAAIDQGNHARAIGALRRSLGLETACAVAVLGIVAWLGTLEPIASAAGSS
ncbi:copper homeostasis membrane protein CopD [Sphingomonas antarctica]|uniref:copper homeostasis membrane protein CopD n=1 Tax=Sphingomonas antarctica TaxID=2040274 RepID=UPI0039EB7CD2